jgi:glycerophosphoryl diester phosphodiesterase
MACPACKHHYARICAILQAGGNSLALNTTIRYGLLGAVTVALAACGDSSNGGNSTAPPGMAPGTPPEGAAIVSAHRGGAAYAPENTMTAFRNAVRLGVDQLEADTQLTADGVLVLIHDDTVDRTTDCSGTVISKTFADLQACDAAHWFSPGQPTTTPDTNRSQPLRGQGIRIPATEELFAYLQQLGDDAPELSIEIKDIPGESNFDPAGTAVAAVLVPLIRQYKLEQKTIVQSFWPAAIDAVKQMAPEIRTQFLTTTSTGQTAGQNLAYVLLRQHDISAPNFDAPDFKPQLIQVAQAAGKQVIPYTPDRESDLRNTQALGVDGLITNFPGCLLRLQGRLQATTVGAGVPAPVCPDELPDSASASIPGRPDPAICAALRPARWQASTGVAASNAKLRVVGIQFKQDVRHVASYDSFRTKMRCLMEDHAMPLRKPGLPMLVVYNEDIGLMTLAIGTRGRLVREQAATPLRAPAGEQAPLGVAGALGLINAAYAPQVLAYQTMFGPIDPRKQMFVAATDTFARAYSQTFSDIARDYGVYVVASNNMTRYRASQDPADIALFKDPDLPAVREVYIATSARVTNQTAIWGPQDVDADAPAGEKNLLFRNDKVPLTALEKDLIAIDEGPATGDEARSNAAGVEVAGFRLGFATSLPAFAWGFDFGQRPSNLEPCADVRISYMPCMDALGVDVVVQAEANPGRWAVEQAGGWQPLEWMESTWRSVSEPGVKFRYNITPHMVGNLLDLPFDGQSAITQRGASAPLRHYVGNTEFNPATDPAEYQHNVGGKPEFIALAPWVTPDAPRDELRATGAKLAPGSGDALENDYLETAVWADLVR